ncbi:MAG: bifunctional oligoribonuclease/PAP phosphatase NrnA [Candidatus Eisenbacteria bacterium]|uniref:Bifunctional oligoribonuclease/PAP phosphatase NrnA n=1 Tax=Eiseniibacteriota bacterium TaxID=2212470 RepID=A0A849SNG1_UNCEI|nr:bifunctional oligoribonuclease/PAP phosphatase NrnA [Candidatus Eisenbacteria bacterium]
MNPNEGHDAVARERSARVAASPERAALHAFLEKHQRFLLTTHINPDGDGIGSEVALARWLIDRGREVKILNDSVLPAHFTFLTDGLTVETWESELAERRFAEADAFVVLDTSNRQRIGRLSASLDRAMVPIAIIDHHVSHAHGFGQVNVIEAGAAATGEIIYDLIGEAGGTITPAIAEGLYVALMTDTGSFKYSNTDSHAHRMAAELLSHGLDPQRLHALVHTHASAGRLRFFGETLARLELASRGQLAILVATPEQFQRHGLAGADTDGLVDLPRTIAGVEAVVLFSEVEVGKVKVSMRSTGRVAVDQIASRHGGGGHLHAAGVLMRGTIEQARDRVQPELERVIAELEPRASGRA